MTAAPTPMLVFERALSAGRPAVVHILMEQDIITTRATLSELRKKTRRASDGRDDPHQSES